MPQERLELRDKRAQPVGAFGIRAPVRSSGVSLQDARGGVDGLGIEWQQGNGLVARLSHEATLCTHGAFRTSPKRRRTPLAALVMHPTGSMRLGAR
jgi:hypothetical protein